MAIRPTIESGRTREGRAPAPRSSRKASLVAGVALLTLVVLATLAIAHFTTQAPTWYLMSDELLWEKLGLSIFESGSPLPHVRGVAADAYSGLYPLLTSIAYARDDMPDAFRAVHQINALLMASAAIPAYLLARDVLVSRLAALLAAALTIAVPWTALSVMVMSEPAAYPAFIWALLGMHRALARPSAVADALALAGIALALYSRTQFIVLVPAFVAAILIHEILQARGEYQRPSWAATLARPLRQHMLVGAVTLLALLVWAGLLYADRAGSVLGGYSATFEGGLPSWSSMLPNVKRVVAWITLNTAMLPVIGGGAWLLATAIRRRAPRPVHAFAVLGLCVTAAVSVSAFVFITKFAGGDRYLFYVAPILFVAMLAGLNGLGGRIPLVTVAATLSLAIWALGYLTLVPRSLAGAHASPGETAVQVFYHWPRRIAAAVGIDNAGHLWAMYLAAGAAAFAAVVLSRWPRPRVTLATGLAVLAFGLALTHYVFGKMLLRYIGPPAPQTLADQNWVDKALPRGASVGIMPSMFGDWYNSARVWWDVEFWNRTVDRVYSVNGADTFTALPVRALSVNPDTGAVMARDQPPYVVLTSEANVFRPRGELVAASPEPILPDQNVHLELWRVELPLRAVWTVTNVDPVHYFRAGQPARIRVFGGRTPESVRLEATVQFAQGAPARRGWVVRSAGGSVRRGWLRPFALQTVATELCLASGRTRDVFFDVAGGPRADVALDGLRLVAVKLVPGARGCGDRS